MKKVYVILIVLMVVFTTGCRKEKELVIYGGDIPKCNTMFATCIEAPLSYELPIISSEKIEDFEVLEFRVLGVGDYHIELKSLTGGEKYKEWYYYFANIYVDADDDIPAEFSLESVDFLINGKKINYPIEEMRFTNTLAVYGEECLDAQEDFVYEVSPVIMYQYIPNNRVQELKVKAQYDCTITGIEALDYINIDDLKWYVNGAEVQMENGIKICAGDILGISYTLSYRDGVSKINIMKTTQSIRYVNNEGKECIFTHPQGFIIVDYANDNFIKGYIDDNLNGK